LEGGSRLGSLLMTGGAGGPSPSGSGLRRFVRRGDQTETAEFIKKLTSSKRPSPPGSVCDMCNDVIPDEHSHVVNIETRTLMCTCRGCYLLFTAEGAAQGKFRCVPERYLYDSSFDLSTQQWDELQIPVKLAFFFHNSTMGRFVAFYPSPAGATESLLDLETWSEILQSNPRLATPEPDVEALLVNKTESGFECFLVPIDVCYELVGIVRLKWKGFDGGEEAWTGIDSFFESLRDRSEAVGRERSA
jgi:hypothetical protein